MDKSFRKSFGRGFTLIELLVVIAIIGILASIILASLAAAESKGRDAKIKEEMNEMHDQAELYTGNGTPVTIITPCPVTTGSVFDTASNGLGTLLNDVLNISSAVRCASATGQPKNGSKWVVAAQLSDGSTWCVDYTGTSKDYPGTAPSGAMTGAGCD